MHATWYRIMHTLFAQICTVACQIWYWNSTISISGARGDNLVGENNALLTLIILRKAYLSYNNPETTHIKTSLALVTPNHHSERPLSGHVTHLRMHTISLCIR